MSLLWDGEYFYLHICIVIKTSGFYLLTELTSVSEVEVRVNFLPALSPLTWLSCVSYCHLLTLFGINILFIKYVVDVVPQFRSEEKCSVKFVSVVVIRIKLRNAHSHERKPLHVDVQSVSCQVNSIVQLFCKYDRRFPVKVKLCL
jgi:hypothetical protein